MDIRNDHLRERERTNGRRKYHGRLEHAREVARRKSARRPKPYVASAKTTAREKVKSAVRAGIICKPLICPQCRRTVPPRLMHAHHEDYSKPLDVVWMCSTCHGLTRRIDFVPEYGLSAC